MNTKIDISKTDRAEALRLLYNAAKPQGLGFLHYTPQDMSLEDASALLAADSRAYFDYVRGRVMKVDLSRPVLRTSLYDRDNGPGAAGRALGLPYIDDLDE